MVSAQQYTWFQYCEQRGWHLGDKWDWVFESLNAAGIAAFEPSVRTAAELRSVLDVMARHGMRCNSLYTPGCFHHDQSEEDLQRITKIAKVARDAGLRVIICNPDPTPKAKTDAELRHQLRHFSELGDRVGAMGLDLAFHMHSAEFRNGGNEFHVMLAATPPDTVKICLDTHWIFRALGNSQVGLEALTRQYLDRIVCLHLRQSQRGIWSPRLEEGDVNHGPLFEILGGCPTPPVVTMEMVAEEGSPEGDPVPDHRQSLAWCRKHIPWACKPIPD